MAQRSLIGIDLGSRFLKALQLSDVGGAYKITGFGIRELGAQDAVAEALRDLLTKKNFATKRCAFGVSGRSVFVRYVGMAPMAPDELRNAARYELGKYIPIEVDEVLHDVQRLDETAPPGGEIRVVLVAAHKTYLDERIALVESTDLVPNVVDVECFALGNAFELANSANSQVKGGGRILAAVDVGASKSNVVILDNLVCTFTREFYKGGDDVTDMIAKKLSLEPAEAERLKRNPGDQVEKLMQACEDVLDDLCQDVKISVDFFENQNDKQVEEIALTGGACGTPGLKETLEKMAGKPVTVWNPIEGFATALDAAGEAELRAHAWQCGIALGLASRFA